jgi:hypothetical protein
MSRLSLVPPQIHGSSPLTTGGRIPHPVDRHRDLGASLYIHTPSSHGATRSTTPFPPQPGIAVLPPRSNFIRAQLPKLRNQRTDQLRVARVPVMVVGLLWMRA